MKKYVKAVGALALSAVMLTGCSLNLNIGDNGTVTETDGEDENNGTSDTNNQENNNQENNGIDGADNGENGTENDGIEGEEGGETGNALVGELGNDADVNCQYFLKIGDRVYFRGYGENAFQNPCLWGKYMDYPNGGESAIYYYDEVSGKTVKVFSDNGYGEMMYVDGKLFMNGIREDGYPYVYAVTLGGEQVKLAKEYSGKIIDDLYGSPLIEETVGGNTVFHKIDSAGKEEWSLNCGSYVNYLGCYQGDIVYTSYDYSENVMNIYTCGIGVGDGNPILVGNISKKTAEQIADYTEYIVSEWCRFDLDGNGYLGVSFRSGTGNVYDGGAIIKFQPWAENSAMIDTPLYVSDSYNMQYIDFAGDYYQIIDNEPYSFATDYSNGDLVYYDYLAEKNIVASHFIDNKDYMEEHTGLVLAEHSSYTTDSTVYAMRVTEIYDMDGAIGWRDGYLASKIEYVKIDPNSGKVDVILTLNYDKNYYGF